jgi:phosphatidylglycerophosphate synthase
MGESRFTWANALTSLRLLIAIPCAGAIVAELWSVAATLFVVAVASDIADGRVARLRQETSAFGALFDHVTDATFVTLLLIALAQAGELPMLLPILVAASFLQYVLDSKALRGKPLRMSQLGRFNGIAYFAIAGTPVIRDALMLPFPPAQWVNWTAWMLVATSIVSMLDRGLALYRQRRVAE